MNRNKTTSLVLFFMLQLFSLCAFSQAKNTLSGIVKDDAAQKPLTYVTVELYKSNQPAQALKSTYTNDKGKFSFTGVDSGSYKIVFSHAGFSDKQQEIIVDPAKDISLDNITLVTAPKALQGVTVTAKKPLVELTDDKIVFNVENDPASKTSTAIDILRKTPFVSVDGDDNVTVNGQSNFKVLLNGRETSMFAQNVKEALKGFPGAVITKIEVITSPSAKYDAEGVGGIINIITKKKVVGYNGSINTYYSSTGWYNINNNLSAKFGKFGASVYYGAGGANNVNGTSRMETVPLVPAYFTDRLLYGSRVSSNFWNYGNAELSYDIDSLNTLALYGNLSGGHNYYTLNQSITTSYPTGPDSISNYNLHTKNEYPTQSVGADYIKHFSNKKDKEFSIRWNGEFGTSNTFLNSLMDNPVIDDQYVINNSIAKNKQYTIQSDYTLPLGNNQKLESGVKAILRHAYSDFDGLTKTNPADQYKANLSNTDQFFYDQNVYSAYSSYNIKWKNISWRLGARLEHTAVNGDFKSSKTTVAQDYTNLLPNLQASVKFNKSFTMVVNYSDRIQRPAISNLNPFRNDNDPHNISFGNPNLLPQTVHNLSVQTRLNKGATFAGITFTGSYSNNMIVQYATFDPATGVTTTTSGNYGKEAAVTANGNFSTRINKDWSVFVNGNVKYNRVQNKFLPGESNAGFSGNANLNTSYSINKYFTAGGYAGFYQNAVTIQTKYPLNVWYGINAGYKFAHEKFTASFGLSNFLQKNRPYKLTTTDPAFRYTSVSISPFRGISGGLSWNFGKLTENVSKKKGVANDDQLTAPASN